MERKLNKDCFAKYFFYGLDNKDEIVKYIILNETKELRKTKQPDKDGEKMQYEIEEEQILELIVQLERFTSLHDDPKNREYFYDSINTESNRVHQIFNENALKLNESFAISLVKYRPVSGIYFNTREYPEEIREKYHKYSGYQLIDKFTKESYWTVEVYEVLKYLNELEKEDRFEYYSLFLDSKYARAIDRNMKRNNR